MTVVIDCNIIVMCLTSRSPYHIIYQSLIKGIFHLALSVDIMFEYHEIIQEKYNPATAHAFIALLKELPNVHFTDPHYKWQLIDADADDNKYCDCAIAGKASYIITQDKHFNILKDIPFPRMHTLSIDEFANMLQSSEK